MQRSFLVRFYGVYHPIKRLSLADLEGVNVIHETSSGLQTVFL